VIERAAILGNGRTLDVASALGVLPPPQEWVSGPEAERDRVVAALERTHGRIEGPFGAARALGVNPHTLRSRMRKLGIDWQRYRSG
jgi:transcriptional regulator with GAF, ATPase, and Fis domain